MSCEEERMSCEELATKPYLRYRTITSACLAVYGKVREPFVPASETRLIKIFQLSASEAEQILQITPHAVCERAGVLDGFEFDAECRVVSADGIALRLVWTAATRPKPPRCPFCPKRAKDVCPGCNQKAYCSQCEYCVECQRRIGRKRRT